jgi:hypothetical protein
MLLRELPPETDREEALWGVAASAIAQRSLSKARDGLRLARPTSGARKSLLGRND